MGNKDFKVIGRSEFAIFIYFFYFDFFGLFKKLIFFGVWLIYNVACTVHFAEQQSESVVHVLTLF